jgi:DNA modification methylase
MANPWPADTVERWPVAKLIPYARNARKHSNAQVAEIAGSISEWGWTIPALIDEGGRIIAGHGRVLAAHKLGITDVPVMIARGWTDAQKQAYTLADNQIALHGTWDLELLKVELADLRGQAVDLSLLGFSDDDVARVIGTKAGLTDPDEVPETPEVPRTIMGDVWLLGEHRLVCGDATSETDVSLCLAGVRPHLMVTDPPYGVEYDPDWRSSLDQWNRATNPILNDERGDWREAWLLFTGNVAYVWHAGTHGNIMQESLAIAGFVIRSQIIWVKPHFAISRGDYHVQHEPCFYAVRKQHTGHWNGDRKQSTVWEAANNTFQGGKLPPEDQRSGKHSTQKPVECMRRPIENNSSPGQAVYDPFVGSGTTIIAAEMTGRRCHAIEISPAYCDVAVVRWQQFTGQHGKRERDGVLLDEIEMKRPNGQTTKTNRAA